MQNDFRQNWGKKMFGFITQTCGYKIVLKLWPLQKITQAFKKSHNFIEDLIINVFFLNSYVCVRVIFFFFLYNGGDINQ